MTSPKNRAVDCDSRGGVEGQKESPSLHIAVTSTPFEEMIHGNANAVFRSEIGDIGAVEQDSWICRARDEDLKYV